MKIYHSIAEMRQFIKTQQGKTLGFVPTMGALHKGHIALVERAKTENDLALCSIFVNPIQFNKTEDLLKYPRTEEADAALLRTVDCDVLFMPSADAFYPKKVEMRMDFGHLETLMEGAFRPGHFSGVGIVLSKFFNILQPKRAYFGQKDLQQCAVVQKLVEELSYDLELVICPTQREGSGLAMSSRNKRLTPNQLQEASRLYKALKQLAEAFLKGRNLDTEKAIVIADLQRNTVFNVEYIEFVDRISLVPASPTHTPTQTAICLAASIGGVRLIDNIIVAEA